MTYEEILKALSCRGEEQRGLFREAHRVCECFMGNGVFCRGIVEFSNVCRKNCLYCGLRRDNDALERYCLSEAEILEAVARIASCGIRTVILQSGEDPAMDASWLAGVIRAIKRRFDIALTLSVGERRRQDYSLWREAGADRYLLKIETTDAQLFNSLCEGGFTRRMECLDELKALGYQTGSGIMTGLPGQSLESIARDILFFKEKGLDMIGIGPFIAHPDTPLAGAGSADITLTLKVVALARIVTRRAHIPATTALGSGFKDYRSQALAAGANVLMLNFTPEQYRLYYDIYPGRKRVEDAEIPAFLQETAGRAGRVVDYSRADI